MKDDTFDTPRWITALIFFCLIFSLSACRSNDHLYPPRILVDVDMEDISEVVLTFAYELKEEKHLHLEQSFAVYDKHINKIRLQFISQDLLEMDQARRLLVDVVEGLLERLNYNYAISQTMRNELGPVAFGPEHLEISINFESYYGLYDDPFFVGWVVLDKGTAYYYAFDIYECSADRWHSRIEPYFKSRSFVKIERKAEYDYKAKHHPKSSAFDQERYHLPQAPPKQPMYE